MKIMYTYVVYTQRTTPFELILHCTLNENNTPIIAKVYLPKLRNNDAKTT